MKTFLHIKKKSILSPRLSPIKKTKICSRKFSLTLIPNLYVIPLFAKHKDFKFNSTIASRFLHFYYLRHAFWEEYIINCFILKTFMYIALKLSLFNNYSFFFVFFNSGEMLRVSNIIAKNSLVGLTLTLKHCVGSAEYQL